MQRQRFVGDKTFCTWNFGLTICVCFWCSSIIVLGWLTNAVTVCESKYAFNLVKGYMLLYFHHISIEWWTHAAEIKTHPNYMNQFYSQDLNALLLCIQYSASITFLFFQNTQPYRAIFRFINLKVFKWFEAFLYTPMLFIGQINKSIWNNHFTELIFFFFLIILYTMCKENVLWKGYPNHNCKPKSIAILLVLTLYCYLPHIV